MGGSGSEHSASLVRARCAQGSPTVRNRMDAKQVAGLLKAPQKVVRDLAQTALRALERVDNLEQELRRAQESHAALSSEKLPVVIVLDRDGWIEVYSVSGLPVKIVNRPDTGNEEWEYITKRVPMWMRFVLEEKPIARGTTKACPTKQSLQLVELMKERIALAQIIAGNTNESNQ